MGAIFLFACVQVLQREAVPLPHKLKRRVPVQPACIRVNPPGGAPFFRLEVYCRKGRGGAPEIPWDAVERAAGRLRTRLLLPAGVCLPAPPPARSAAQAQLEPGLRAFSPKRLPLLLSLRMAQQVLRASRVPAQQLRVTVVDTKGTLCHAIDALAPLAGSLRVYTPDAAQYKATAARLLRRWGATLILSDSPGCFAQSHVVVADDLRLFSGCERGLIFSPDTHTPLKARVVRCRAPQLPEAYAGLCPPGIDPLLFACALYELCGIKEMERLQFGHFAFDNVSRVFSVQELGGLIEMAGKH
ncbi:MAG: hypothetical protein LBG83_04075 [Oscillospiraceae bacterium]|jgi:hypothetical protein|nr:hypothetical protein [Oscillospiraceae bacterium]